MPLNDSQPFSACQAGIVPRWVCFGYYEMLDFMQQRALSEAGASLPSNPIVWDVSLMNAMVPDEFPLLQVEQAYWKQFPERGYFTNWVIYGEQQCPADETNSTVLIEKARTFSKWGWDKIDSRISTLHAAIQMSAASSASLIVVFHCYHGADRTGEMAASYQMRYQNVSWPMAMKTAYGIAGRHIAKENQYAAQWYCLYLQYALEMPNLGCLDPI